MVKKRKLSGINSIELSHAYDALTKFRASFQYEFVDEQAEGAESAKVDRLEEQLDGPYSVPQDFPCRCSRKKRTEADSRQLPFRETANATGSSTLET